jgi:hypothetical protein
VTRVLTLAVGLLSLLGPIALAAETPAPEAPSLIPIYIVVGALIVLTATLTVYVWGLRNRTSDAANVGDPNSRKHASLVTAYIALPLGIPRGSVRAMLALIIVFGSMAFLAVSMWSNGTQYKFPDALTGILGAILGFYFGKGSSTDDGQAVSAVVAAIDKANEASATARQAQADAASASEALNAALSLVMQVPAMQQALAQQLQAGGRDVALDVVRLALAADGDVALVAKYPDARSPA